MFLRLRLRLVCVCGVCDACARVCDSVHVCVYQRGRLLCACASVRLRFVARSLRVCAYVTVRLCV